MKIVDVILSKGLTGFYFDDQRAIRSGKIREDGFAYLGEAVTSGFTKVRQAGESVPSSSCWRTARSPTETVPRCSIQAQGDGIRCFWLMSTFL